MKTHYAVLILFLTISAYSQSIDQVYLSPQNPYACNSFDVIVSGNLPMSGYYVVGQTIDVTNNFINITIVWDAPPIGLPVILPYTHTVSVLANSASAGLWGLVVTNIFVGTGQITGSHNQSITLLSCCNAIADISINQPSACYNDTIQVTDASSGYNTVTWYLNGTPFGTTPGNFQIYGLPGGTYTLTQVADTSGCSSSDSVTFSFGYMPENGFNVIQTGHDFTFTASGSSAYNYTWDFGDGSTGQGAFVTHAYAADGQYQVCLTSTGAGGCVADSCITVNYSTVGLNDNKSLELSLYPNPAKEFVTIRNASTQPKMYDVIGRECAVKFTKSGNEWTAKVSHLPKGMYLVQADGKVMKLVID